MSLTEVKSSGWRVRYECQGFGRFGAEEPAAASRDARRKAVQAPSVDNDGYLVEPDQWTEEWARETARAMSIELTPEHWEAIRFMRAFYEEHRVPADARFVMRHLTETRGAPRNRLFELFPYGYPGQACKIAGMRRPRVWSTG